LDQGPIGTELAAGDHPQGVPTAQTPSIFDPVSSPALAIRELSFVVLGLSAVIFVVVAGVAAYTLVRFRNRHQPIVTSPAIELGQDLQQVDVETGGVQRFVRLTMFIFRLGMRQRGPRRQRLAKELPQLVELLGESRNLFGNACCG